MHTLEENISTIEAARVRVRKKYRDGAFPKEQKETPKGKKLRVTVTVICYEKVVKCHCTGCGHDWKPNLRRPGMCPKCGRHVKVIYKKMR